MDGDLHLRHGVTPEQLKNRTQKFAVDVIHLCRELPTTLDGRRCGSQLLDAATAVAANYRAACRGRSRAEFAAKLGVVVEEADECLFWLQLIIAAGLLPRTRIAALLREADELTAIFVASRNTVMGHK